MSPYDRVQVDKVLRYFSEEVLVRSLQKMGGYVKMLAFSLLVHVALKWGFECPLAQYALVQDTSER